MAGTELAQKQEALCYAEYHAGLAMLGVHLSEMPHITRQRSMLWWLVLPIQPPHS